MSIPDRNRLPDCPLRTNSVYPWLSENPLVFLIGEAPGEEEDKTGIPFVGRAGKKLRSWLSKFKLDDCFAVGNACLHRPYDESPDGTRTNWNRVPTEQEMAACKPILDRYLSRAQSKVVVFVGGTSAKFLGEYKGTVGRMVGRWKEYNGIPCTVIYHPSALLRPMAKAKRDDMERMNFSVLQEVAIRLGLSAEQSISDGVCKECGEPAEAAHLCIRHLRGLVLAKIVNAGWPRMMAAGKVREGWKWCQYLREASPQELASLLPLL